ncbi:MAG: ribosomal-protein-alanine N-acetyltransferase, partial [Chloroflexi bacterium]|nr:ribosomal-protein-alanine N-acetyltransferase [Chloroflexota bacterium]
FLEVRAGNLGAQALYQKYGFVVDGVRPHYYKDNNEDAVLMTLARLESLNAQLAGKMIVQSKTPGGT